MALEALSSTELLNFIMYDTGLAAPAPLFSGQAEAVVPTTAAAESGGGRKKRRRRAKVCKNKEEAENQRMTHIAVERNRRKQMNEHLAVLKSLMPQSYVHRGDQASIVGGAIEFVKDLEHILQSLEAKKFALLQKGNGQCSSNNKNNNNNNTKDPDDECNNKVLGTSTTSTSSSPFGQFFAYPQFSCFSHQLGSKFTSHSKAAIADIEVTLIETHASIRILSRHHRSHYLSRIVAFFHSVLLTILHLSVTTLNSLVLYSVSTKVEEGCQLSSADDIAGAVHHMLRIIEEEAILCSHS